MKNHSYRFQDPAEHTRRYLVKCLVLALLLSLIHSTCPADEKPKAYHCTTQLENGVINWSTGNILAIGTASPEDNSETSHESVPGSAKADANRQILKVLKQIKINTALSVDAYASKNDVILAGMEKTARDAKIKKQYYTSALAVEIMIETSMFGGFLQLVLPEEIRQIPSVNLENLKADTKGRVEKPYTGLIIDARGLLVEPVLNPVIVSEQGHPAVSSAFISRDFAVQKGVCKYICSMDQALQDERIGENPLVLKGLRIEEKLNTAIVISMSDYRLLENATERHGFLRECRIIIVKD